MARIAAVVVSVGYSDFLAHTLLFNKHVFDYLLVVTTPEDKETQRLCEYHHVDVLPTDAFHEGGGFNKAKGINQGLARLQSLGYDDWYCHLDADIVLPPRTRLILGKRKLDPACLYSMDRLMCNSYASWLEFLHHPRLHHENDIWLHLDAFPIGVRVVQAGAWLPIGYLQIWSASECRRYPAEHSSAARTDMQFALQWPPERRVFIPELVCLHLATEAPEGGMGQNWNGRKTPRFGLLTPEEMAAADVFAARVASGISAGEDGQYC